MNMGIASAKKIKPGITGRRMPITPRIRQTEAPRSQRPLWTW